VSDTNTAAAPAAPAAPTTTTTLAPELTVESARARRAEIANNPELAAKYRRGDAELNKEMRKLNDKIANQDTAALVQSALNEIEPGNEFGNMTTRGILARHEYASAAQQLVPALGKENFQAIAAGTATVSEAAHAEAVQMKKMVLSDKEWVAAYRSGSEAHKQQLTRIHAVLGCSIAEPGRETLRVKSPLSSGS
jgi:hypothetical protein